MKTNGNQRRTSSAKPYISYIYFQHIGFSTSSIFLTYSNLDNVQKFRNFRTFKKRSFPKIPILPIHKKQHLQHIKKGKMSQMSHAIKRSSAFSARNKRESSAEPGAVASGQNSTFSTRIKTKSAIFGHCKSEIKARY